MNLKQPVIFVVEDDKAYNKLITSYLKSYRFKKVHSFYSGEDVIENLDLKPDIFIQDYELDGMNGIEVLKKVKKENSKIEFIFLSGQNSIEVAVDAMKYGAFDYLIKDSVIKEKLIYKLAKLLKMQKLQFDNLIYKSGLIFFFIAIIIGMLFLFFKDLI